MFRIAAVISLLLLPAAAQADAEHWDAMSKTAMSITGDIVIDGDRLTFAGGKSIVLQPYEMARKGDWAASGEEIAGDVFKVAPPSSPKLKRHKPLCAQPATYVVLWTFGEGELTLNVYSGAAAPIGVPDADALCATYSYELR
jgi:hypothetical protein